ncbi:MAG: glutaminase [Phaeodactylibacter sp.]|nr:glutaminase [Phaeodactylibacter sp.]MCB9049424.1 glutaminase [Lewinellaceae bacterium]
MPPDYPSILNEIAEAAKSEFGKGKVANYIPALAQVPAEKFGIALETIRGEQFGWGDSEERFSIQSISKVFTLALAFRLEGENLWKRVGLEPSGNPFNSLVQLEYEQGIPRNPFINAGALVVTDVLLEHYADPKAAILEFIHTLTGQNDIAYDLEVARSERETGYTNAALVNFMKSHGNIRHSVAAVLDVYFHQCSIAMSCRELARAFLLFANHGAIPATGERILTKSQAKRLNAIMLTCGFYDEAGEFAFAVGLPGKSGVGGGIVAIIPGELAIAVWSPELNEHGNSVLGIKALEMFTTLTGMSIF